MSKRVIGLRRDAAVVSSVDLVVEPLTSRLWPAFSELMDEGGPSRRCWCMYWRIGATYGKCSPDRNRAAFRDVVAHGRPPGLVAMDGPTAVGWCQVTARDDLPALDRPWRLRRVDDSPVWCISCFYVRKDWRHRGVMTALIEAAAAFARGQGAPAVEVYPIDAQVSPSATSTGYADTFTRLGFTEVARRSPERPIMRFEMH